MLNESGMAGLRRSLAHHRGLAAVVRWTSTLALFAALLCCPAALLAQDEAGRPNIVVIAVDDLNDWVGALNTHPQVQTPNIDRLAARGTIFTNHHVQAPLCNPSRTSMLTGLRPSTTGIYGLSPNHRDVPEYADFVTLPQYFAAHGYRTLTAGKIFHNNRYLESEFQVIGPAGGIGATPEEKLVSAPVHMGNHPLLDWGIFPEADETQLQDFTVATWAEEQIEQLTGESEQPFFMAVGFFHPHVPLYSPRRYFNMYPPEEDIVLPAAPIGDRDDVPEFAWNLHWYLPEPRLSWVIENAEWEAKVRAYLAAVTFADAQIGRVLNAIEANGLADNTIVVIWGDHGYHLGEKDITGKNTLWERATRTPLIFAGPGVSAGARSRRPAESLDIYPTLVELAGLPANPENEGLSLVPQLRNAAASRERPAMTTANPGNHAVRTEDWRYIRYADGSEELYDHKRDPQEWTNLAGRPEYAGVIAQLARWLPATDAPHAPGSASRILYQENGTWYWEGEPIVADELIR